MSQPVISLRHIVKSYFIGQPNELEILHGMNLDIYPGEFVSIVGESGSGKSTLMNIIGALDKPTSGQYRLNGLDMVNIKDKEASHIRNKEIGFVFQTYNLIGRMNALKNVELPMLYAGMPARQREEKAAQLLKMVGMEDRMKHMPNELSGGQKQRVAIARAIANDPSIVLADEPTGALDSATSREVMDLFHELHDEHGATIVLITHNQRLAQESQRIIQIADGRIIGVKAGRGRA
jgi:putative ABC transport system ATP-binding protein